MNATEKKVYLDTEKFLAPCYAMNLYDCWSEFSSYYSEGYRNQLKHVL